MSTVNKAPVWFWVVSVLALAWNVIGVMAYIQQTTMAPEALQALPEAERALIAATPAWVTASFATAVFGGAAGCLLLLLRSRLAMPVLLLSLIGVIVQTGYTLLISDALAVYGPGGLAMPLTILVVAALLPWFARHAARRRWVG